VTWWAMLGLNQRLRACELKLADTS
jgi:hypothetical protein